MLTESPKKRNVKLCKCQHPKTGGYLVGHYNAGVGPCKIPWCYCKVFKEAPKK